MALKTWIRKWLDIPTEEEMERRIFAKSYAATCTHFKSFQGHQAVRDCVQQSVVALAKSDISALIHSNIGSEKILDDIVARLKKKQLK